MKQDIDRLIYKKHRHKNRINRPQSNGLPFFYMKFTEYQHVQIPIQFSSAIDENQLPHTHSLDTLDIIAIPTKEQLPAIRSKLRDFNMYKVQNNTEFIRDDILIYIQSEDCFFFYAKNEQRQWILYRIERLFAFIYYLSNYFKSNEKITFSNDVEKYTKLETLYAKSSENRKQYNTIGKKNAKKEAQS